MELPVNYDRINSRTRKLVREEYVKLQDGKCQYCLDPLSSSPPSDITSITLDMRLFPPNMLKHPVHLHHDHVTGLTIGAVHAYCNCILFQYHGE